MRAQAISTRIFAASEYLTHKTAVADVRYLALPSVMWAVVLAAAFGTVALGMNFGIEFRGFEKQVVLIDLLLAASMLLSKYATPLIYRTRILLEAVAFVAAGVLVGRYLAYELQVFGSPLQDANFAWLDSSVGFDYVANMIALDSHPMLCEILHHAYYSFRYQVAGTVLVFAVMANIRVLGHFLLALFLALCFCAFVSALYPAVGAVTQINDMTAFRHLTFDGATPVAHLNALRDGTMRVLNLSDLGGIITFPSFHVVMAVVITYAWRSTGILVIPVSMLNVLMSASAMSQGGHYLVDCVAGIAVSAIAIVAAYALIGWRPWAMETSRMAATAS